MEESYRCLREGAGRGNALRNHVGVCGLLSNLAQNSVHILGRKGGGLGLNLADNCQEQSGHGKEAREHLEGLGGCGSGDKAGICGEGGKALM